MHRCYNNVKVFLLFINYSWIISLLIPPLLWSGLAKLVIRLGVAGPNNLNFPRVLTLGITSVIIYLFPLTGGSLGIPSLYMVYLKIYIYNQISYFIPLQE